MSHKTLTVTALIVTLLSGCANTRQAMTDSNDRIDDNIKQTAAAKEGFAIRKNDVVVLNDTGVWVSPKSFPTAVEKPAILSEKISLSKGYIGLDSISEEITRRLGISVKLGPEIILTMKASTSTNAETSGLTSGDTTSSTATTTMPTESLSPIDKSIYYTGLTYTGSLEGLLDVLSARMNISWEINPQGDLKIYRYLTKTFVIAAPHGESGFDVGSESQGTSSTNSSVSSSEGSVSGSSTISSRTNSKQSPWDNTAEAVKAFLSYEGRAAINEAAGTITITDVKLVVDRVGEYISQQNENYLRQAAISVTVYSIESTDDIGYGVNWGLIYKKLTDYSLTTASPVGLLGAGAGSVSALILEDPTKNSTFAGTNALFEALRTQGKVTTVTSGSVLALNHRPSSIRLGLSEGYLKSSSTTVTANVGSTTALEDGRVDTGSVMALLPNIIDSERLTLQMSINISALIGQIREFKSGDNSLFAPKKSIMEINYPVSLKTGQTLVLGGLEDNSDSNNARSMADSALLGGGKRNMTKKTSIVIVVKSVIL
tara:strand:+ start:14580 stop:16208 length:1629 start_codon:yes stop_codon:yes gene_type:complete